MNEHPADAWAREAMKVRRGAAMGIPLSSAEKRQVACFYGGPQLAGTGPERVRLGERQHSFASEAQARNFVDMLIYDAYLEAAHNEALYRGEWGSRRLATAAAFDEWGRGAVAVAVPLRDYPPLTTIELLGDRAQ